MCCQLRMRSTHGSILRMTKPQESKNPLSVHAAATRWRAATHRGAIELLGAELPCFVLDDGRRVLSNRGITASLNMVKGGQGGSALGNDRLRRFVRGKAMSRFLDQEVIKAIEEPIRFRVPEGENKSEAFQYAHGYEATVLVAICQAVLQARDAKALQPQQMHIAVRCDLLIRGFANLGIIALIDEATGYQNDRARDALAEILEAFVAKELAAWVKTFPDEFYVYLARLRGEKVDDITKHRPLYYGTLTKNIVYERLAPGVLAELEVKNPRSESGRRKAKHHQWLTREIGHPKLKEHITKVVTVMQLAKDYESFMTQLDVVAPRKGDTLTMPFMAQM